MLKDIRGIFNFVTDLAAPRRASPPWSLCGSVVEHRSAESEDPRFDSLWGLRIFSLSHTRDKTKKNIILDISGLSRSRSSPLALRDMHFFASGKIWDSRGKICRDLSGTYTISATPLTDLAPALVAPGLQHTRGQRIARAKALILRALSWALCKLDVDVWNLSMSLENRRKTSTKLFIVTAFFLKQNMFKFFFTALLYQKLNKT